MQITLYDVLRDRTRASAEAPALSHGDETLSYAELDRRVRACAAMLAAHGVRRGDRVAIFLEKRPETVISLFAAAAIGAAFVPVNPVLKPAQVMHILTDSGARVLVTSPSRWRGLAEPVGAQPEAPTVVLVGASGELLPPCVPWAEHGVLGESPGAVVDADLAAILYTSGSTGTPKGVALSHRNLLAGAQSVNAYLPNGPDDVLLAVLPLSFDAGLSQVTTGIAAGAHVVLMNYLLPADVPRLCERHGVTAMTCVPPLWIQLSELEWGAAGERIRYFANTGGRMPRRTLDRLRAVFPNAAPYLMYGLTEAFRSTYLDPAEVDARPDSIGRAIPNAEVLVLRPDGSPCDVDEPGELVHRGALVAMGYWRDAARTAERFRPVPGVRDGWSAPEIAVWSGDIVRRDADGFLFFVGRGDDMIKTSGYRVSPTEVEEAALATGLVREAVALGMPDEALGHRILLVVGGAAGDGVAGALTAALRRELPLYMVPGAVVERPSLPRGVNGKFDRLAIRHDVEGSP